MDGLFVFWEGVEFFGGHVDFVGPFENGHVGVNCFFLVEIANADVHHVAILLHAFCVVIVVSAFDRLEMLAEPALELSPIGLLGGHKTEFFGLF